MRFPRSIVLVLISSLAAALPAQTGEVLRFDEGCGLDTLAYPLGGTNAPVYAKQIFSNQSSMWTAGKWGSAMQGCVDPSVTGARSTFQYLRVSNRAPSGSDFTMAFWIKQRVAVARRQQVVLGNPLVQILADQPSGALEMVFSSASPFAILRTTTNVVAQASGRWVHVAFVHDAANLKVTLYIDASFEASASLTSPLTLPASWDVGHRGGTSGTSYYDIDEIFAEGRALTVGELQNLRMFPVAGVGEFDGGCSQSTNAMSLQWLGTAPVIGASGTLRMTSQWPAPSIPQGSALALAFGDNRCQYLGLQLPFDLSSVFPSLPRCTLVHNQNLLIVSAPMGASGNLDIPLTVPAGALMIPLYGQAFAVEPGGTLRISNGLALAIGN